MRFLMVRCFLINDILRSSVEPNAVTNYSVLLVPRVYVQMRKGAKTYVMSDAGETLDVEEQK